VDTASKKITSMTTLPPEPIIEPPSPSDSLIDSLTYVMDNVTDIVTEAVPEEWLTSNSQILIVCLDTACCQVNVKEDSLQSESRSVVLSTSLMGDTNYLRV